MSGMSESSEGQRAMAGGDLARIGLVAASAVVVWFRLWAMRAKRRHGWICVENCEKKAKAGLPSNLAAQQGSRLVAHQVLPP